MMLPESAFELALEEVDELEPAELDELEPQPVRPMLSAVTPATPIRPKNERRENCLPSMRYDIP